MFLYDTVYPSAQWCDEIRRDYGSHAWEDYSDVRNRWLDWFGRDALLLNIEARSPARRNVDCYCPW
jgi:hypothetical protein